MGAVMDRLYIIIPAYNEQDNLGALIKEWYPIIEQHSADNSSRLVIINDGSKDDTYKVLKDLAKAEGDKMIEQARQSIQAEKTAAMSEIKNQIGVLSVTIAESILKQKLDNDGAQNALVENILNKSNLN